MANVKLLHMLNGEDILGNVIEKIETNSEFYSLENPCLIGLTTTEDGKPNLSLQPLVFFSRQKVVDINRSHVVYMVEVDNQIEMQYNQMFGNIITPDSKIML